MNILYVTSTFTPSVNGVAISVSNYYKNLKKLGHNVTVLAPSAGSKQKDQDDASDIIRYPATINPMVEDYPIPLAPISIHTYRELRDVKFDIVHSHHPYQTGYFAELYASRSDAPYVMTYHTRYTEYSDIYLKYLPRAVRQKITEMSVEDFFAKANLVIAPSNAIKKLIAKDLPFVESVKMPSGIEPIKDDGKDKLQLRGELNFPKDRKILLSLCRVAKEKNLDMLLDSLKILSEEYYLVIVGDGPYREQLEKNAHKIGVGDKVSFTGKVPHDQVGKYYRAADLFLMPSTSETQGMTLLEAQYHGLLPVSVDCPVNREWTATGGVLVGNEAVKFSDAIRSAIRFEDKHKKEIIDWASQYTNDNLAKQLEGIYQDLIDRKSLSLKLTNYGWQSWSTKRDPLIKIPRSYYPPSKDKTLIPAKPSTIPRKPPVKGWCSWYAFHRDIDHQRIVEQARYISENNDKYPLEYILIDDGWCQWGDWDKTNNEKFPKDIKGISNEIQQLGLKTGLWLAPFMTMTDSEIARNRPNWIVTNIGRPVNAMKVMYRLDNFSPVFRYMLDVRNSDVLDNLHSTINKLVSEADLKLLKLDYMYAPYYYPGMSRNEASSILTNFYEKVRQDNPEVHIMACGSPFKPALGYVDSMRVGPDTFVVGMYRKPIMGRMINAQRVKGAVYKIRGTMWTQKYWNVDPDVFVCRKELNFTDRLIRYQRDVVADVVENGGNLWLGDDLTKLDDRRRERYVKSLVEV